MITLLSTQVFAKKDDKESKRGHFKKMIEELSLSEEQVAKIKEHRKQSKTESKALRSQMKDIKEKMKASFISDASSSELSTLSSQMDSLRDKIGKIKFSKMLLFKNILDQNQRVKFMELKPKRRRK
jgi:Spy/CpxP family protein refolding chaperone